MKIDVRLVRGHREQARLEIGGVDVTRYVLAEGFAINADPECPLVTLTLRPDVLDVEVEGPAGDILQQLRFTSTSTGDTP